MSLEKLLPKPPSEDFLNKRYKIADKFWTWLEQKYGEAILDEESTKNLCQANELLNTGSLVIYINHQQYTDTPVVIGLALKHLPNAKNYLGPAGMKHFDIKRSPIFGLLLRSLRMLHIYAIPVIQHNDLQKENYDTGQKAIMATELRELARMVLSDSGMVYGVAPEGTRNKDGKLTEGRYGLGRLRELHEPGQVGYLPIAMIYPNQSEDGRLHIKVGQHVFWDAVVDPEALPEGDDSRTIKQRDKIVTDALMLELAKLLPDNMQGYYG